MNTESTKQSGFSMVIGVIAVVLVIGVVGLIGWRLFSQSSKQTNDTTSNNTNTSKTPVSNNNQSTTPPAQPTDPNAGYLVIKEWGVRFKPASGLDGLRYAIQSNNSVAVFSTPSITAVDPKCSETASGFSGIGSLSYYAVGTQQPFNATSLATIKGYSYYYSATGGGDCVSDTSNTTGQTLLHTQEQDLGSSIKSLEAAQ